MKGLIPEVVTVMLFLFSWNGKVLANTWEFSMQVTSDGRTLISGRPISLYYVNDVSYGFLSPIRSCTSSGGTQPGVNFKSDIGDHNTSDSSWQSLPNVDASYYLRVNDDYVELDINFYNSGGDADFELLYNAAAHDFSIVYNNRGIALGVTHAWPYTELSVLVDQRLQSGTSTGSVNRWNGTFTPLPHLDTTYKFSSNTTQVLRGDQNIQSGQKYNRWSVNNVAQSDVTNHHSFMITPQTTSLTSDFAVTNDATLKSVLTDNGSVFGAPKFMDPWLNDATDPGHGNSSINRGMSAPFDTVTYSQNDIGIGSAHLGVFLGLDPALSATNYYSVQAALTTPVGGYTALFTGWYCSGASLEQHGSNPSGYDQKAVVFTSPGATVTANYSRTTVSSNVIIPAGTYSFMGTLTVNSGVTLTISSGAVLNFPAGASLVVNGAVNANGVKFNFTQSSPYSGITIN